MGDMFERAKSRILERIESPSDFLEFKLGAALKMEEQSFAALGIKPDEKPCPTIEAIDKEGRANVKIAADGMVDAVILSGCAETEHHEIAVYNTLIRYADALGHGDVVTRLRRNLAQEQHTCDEVERAMQKTAQERAHAGAR
jgi:ferritin-like metal-binding protein YciE